MPWKVDESLEHALEVAESIEFPDVDLGKDPEVDFDSIHPARPDDDLPDERDAWEQMPDESDAAFEAFKIFRGMGYARSRRAVAEQVDFSKRWVDKVALAHHWEKRAREWDRERERIYAGETAEHVKEMAERHLRVVAAGIDAVAVAFAPIVERFSTNPEGFIAEVGELDVKKQFDIMVAAARTLPALIDAERKILNQPTEIQQINVEHSGEVTHQSRSDLADIVEILASVNGLRGGEVSDQRSRPAVIDVGARDSLPSRTSDPEDE